MTPPQGSPSRGQGVHRFALQPMSVQPQYSVAAQSVLLLQLAPSVSSEQVGSALASSVRHAASPAHWLVGVHESPGCCARVSGWQLRSLADAAAQTSPEAQCGP